MGGLLHCTSAPRLLHRESQLRPAYHLLVYRRGLLPCRLRAGHPARELACLPTAHSTGMAAEVKRHRAALGSAWPKCLIFAEIFQARGIRIKGTPPPPATPAGGSLPLACVVHGAGGHALRRAARTPLRRAAWAAAGLPATGSRARTARTAGCPPSAYAPDCTRIRMLAHDRSKGRAISVWHKYCTLASPAPHACAGSFAAVSFADRPPARAHITRLSMTASSCDKNVRQKCQGVTASDRPCTDHAKGPLPRRAYVSAPAPLRRTRPQRHAQGGKPPDLAGLAPTLQCIWQPRRLVSHGSET